MLTQVYPNIYCCQIPLPRNPLKWLNSYLIVSNSSERNLIIDTGFNRPECKEALTGGLAELKLDLSKTDVLLTHLHTDHTGLAGFLEEGGARIYAGAKESAVIREQINPEWWRRFPEMVTLLGLSQYEITCDDHPGYRFRPESAHQCLSLNEGDQIKCGDYVLSVIDIPGHTPGQIGLYEAKHKLFFCGDHILSSITPNITFWGFEQDSLAQYQASLRKVYDLEIDWLFTAHREIIRDYRSRIRELELHHEGRLQEIRDILAEGTQTVNQVASRMTWALTVKTWDQFPKAQKIFAAGEAAAHLEYLANSGQAKRQKKNGVLYYSL